MKEKILKTLCFLPFIVFLLFYIIMAFSFKIEWLIVLGLLLLLFMISFSLISKNKIFQIIGLISLIIYLVISIIMGYKDYLKWTITIVGSIVCAYYVVMYLVTKKLRKE